jgi:hypothetical protein
LNCDSQQPAEDRPADYNRGELQLQRDEPGYEMDLDGCRLRIRVDDVRQPKGDDCPDPEFGAFPKLSHPYDSSACHPKAWMGRQAKSTSFLDVNGGTR